MNKFKKYLNRKYGLLPILLFSILAALISAFTIWTNDAVAYTYYSPVFDELTTKGIYSLKDVLGSQIDHYLTTNGRFAVHFIVQIFCALIGKIPFAISQGVIWFLLIYSAVRFSDRDLYDFKTCWLVAASMWLVFISLPMDPPFQINYVWVATFTLIWFRVFNKDYNKISSFILLALYSIFCGSLHEGFSIPLSAALLTYMLVQRLKISLLQYIMTIGYWIGTILTVIAPGNFIRLSNSEATNAATSFAFLNFIEDGIYLWILLAILVIILFLIKPKEPISPESRKTILTLTIAAVVSFALCCYLGHFGRIIIPSYFFIILILFLLLRVRKIPNLLIIIVVSSSLAATYPKIYKQKDLNNLTTKITANYHHSSNGIVYMPQDQILNNLSEITSYKWVYTKRERLEDPDKPIITIRPEWMKNPKYESDTNLIVQVSPQAWVLFESKSHPANFYINKVLLPGFLNKELSPRKVDFNSEEITFDTIGPRRVALYINHRRFIKSSISMEDHKSTTDNHN